MENRQAVTVGMLFADPPSQWGLRGDPHLWQDMQAVLDDRQLPGSAAGLEKLLGRSFEALTGHGLDSADRALEIAAYHRPNGGMSNGMVSTPFWRETAIPLIINRYLQETSGHGEV